MDFGRTRRFREATTPVTAMVDLGHSECVLLLMAMVLDAFACVLACFTFDIFFEFFCLAGADWVGLVRDFSDV